MQKKFWGVFLVMFSFWGSYSVCTDFAWGKKKLFDESKEETAGQDHLHYDQEPSLLCCFCCCSLSLHQLDMNGGGADEGRKRKKSIFTQKIKPRNCRKDANKKCKELLVRVQQVFFFSSSRTTKKKKCLRTTLRQTHSNVQHTLASMTLKEKQPKSNDKDCFILFFI